jgi:hypothetical protein
MLPDQETKQEARRALADDHAQRAVAARDLTADRDPAIGRVMAAVSRAHQAAADATWAAADAADAAPADHPAVVKADDAAEAARREAGRAERCAQTSRYEDASVSAAEAASWAQLAEEAASSAEGRS